jgi:hypothetical protein
LLLLILPCAAPAQNAPDDLLPSRAEGRQRDVVAIFHPTRVSAAFSSVSGALLLVSQSVSVALVIGSFISRMRSSDNQMEGVAGMMLRVAFIATVPLWMSLVGTSSDMLAEELGQRAVLSAPTQGAEAGQDLPEVSPLLRQVALLEAQWRLDSSPVRDALDARSAPKPGKEDEWLATGWNWTRSARSLRSGQMQPALSDAEEAERAGFLHRVVFAVAFAVQGTQIAFYLAETLRLFLFNLGCALLPLMIAGLGSERLAPPACKGLLELACLCFWPLGWALANAGSAAMLTPALDMLRKNAASAMYPKLADETTRTVALSAPFLSWSLIGLLAAITLALCAWMLGSLVLVPWLAHRLGGAAACFRAE